MLSSPSIFSVKQISDWPLPLMPYDMHVASCMPIKVAAFACTDT